MVDLCMHAPLRLLVVLLRLMGHEVHPAARRKLMLFGPLSAQVVCFGAGWATKFTSLLARSKLLNLGCFTEPQVVLFCAGWAMKFIPLLGRALKELALEGATQYDVSHFAIGRPSVIKGGPAPAPAHSAAGSSLHASPC